MCNLACEGGDGLLIHKNGSKPLKRLIEKFIVLSLFLSGITLSAELTPSSEQYLRGLKSKYRATIDKEKKAAEGKSCSGAELTPEQQLLSEVFKSNAFESAEDKRMFVLNTKIANLRCALSFATDKKVATDIFDRYWSSMPDLDISQSVAADIEIPLGLFDSSYDQAMFFGLALDWEIAKTWAKNETMAKEVMVKFLEKKRGQPGGLTKGENESFLSLTKPGEVRENLPVLSNQNKVDCYVDSGLQDSRSFITSIPVCNIEENVATQKRATTSPGAIDVVEISSPLLTQPIKRVEGYFKSNGTYVAPHYRTKANSQTYDNWSSRGNINPFTGKRGFKR